jgi:hypothetical protein
LPSFPPKGTAPSFRSPIDDPGLTGEPDLRKERLAASYSPARHTTTSKNVAHPRTFEPLTFALGGQRKVASIDAESSREIDATYNISAGKTILPMKITL